MLLDAKTVVSVEVNQLIYSIQMLRFVAALLVVVFHSISSLDARLGDDWAELRYLAGFGASGVHIFFVISGFIMVYTARDHFGEWSYPRKFLRRRVIRIYPVYWILALINIPVSLMIALPVPETGEGLFRSLMLWPGASSDLIFVGWTLSYEMFFYVVFSGLVLLSLSRAVIALSTIFLGLIVLGRLTDIGGSGAGYLATSPLLLEFVLGAWIGWCAIRFPALPGWAGIVAVAFGLVGFAASIAWGYNRAPLVILWGIPSTILVFGLIYLNTVTQLEGVFRRFALLGESSYALYLIHAIVIPTTASLLMHDVVLTSGVLAIWSAGITVICIIVSMLFCVYIERPLTHWLNRLFRSETAAARQVQSAQR